MVVEFVKKKKKKNNNAKLPISPFSDGSVYLHFEKLANISFKTNIKFTTTSAYIVAVSDELLVVKGMLFIKSSRNCKYSIVNLKLAFIISNCCSNIPYKPKFNFVSVFISPITTEV